MRKVIVALVILLVSCSSTKESSGIESIRLDESDWSTPIARYIDRKYHNIIYTTGHGITVVPMKKEQEEIK